MQEFLIPVAFDVTAPDEETAARIVAETIGSRGLLDTIRDASSREGGEQMIESWWFPEARHKHIDGNDNDAMTLVEDAGENDG